MPPLGFGGIGIFFFGFDTALFFERNDLLPLLGLYRIFYFFAVITAIGQHYDLLGVMRTEIVLKVKIFNIIDNIFMFRPIFQTIFPAIGFRAKRNWRQRNQYIIEKQYDIRPLMPDYEA